MPDLVVSRSDRFLGQLGENGIGDEFLQTFAYLVIQFEDLEIMIRSGMGEKGNGVHIGVAFVDIREIGYQTSSPREEGFEGDTIPPAPFQRGRWVREVAVDGIEDGNET